MHVCGNREQFGDGSPALKLQTNRPLVLIKDVLPGWAKDDIYAWLAEGYARWGAVCDIRIKARIFDLSEASPTDYVQYVTVADLGTGGVLADQMLPGGQRVLQMRINIRIRWKPTDGPMQSGTIDPIRTLEHESGHFYGLQHFPVGAPPELMEPSISQTIIRPQPTEARVVAGWFGPPVVTPVPPIPPTPTPGQWIELTTLVKSDGSEAKVLSVKPRAALHEPEHLTGGVQVNVPDSQYLPAIGAPVPIEHYDQQTYLPIYRGQALRACEHGYLGDACRHVPCHQFKEPKADGRKARRKKK